MKRQNWNCNSLAQRNQAELTCKISLVLSNLSIGSWSISNNAHKHTHIHTEVVCENDGESTELHETAKWPGGLALSGNALVLINEVALQRSRLVPWWVTVFAEPATQVYSAWPPLCGKAQCVSVKAEEEIGSTINMQCISSHPWPQRTVLAMLAGV